MVANHCRHDSYGTFISTGIMKKYHLLYEFHGSPRHLEFTDLFEFDQELSRVMSNPQIVNKTIDFYTTKPLPVTLSNEFAKKHRQ